MKKTLFYIAFASILIACNKEKSSAKKIFGDWSITTFKKTDPEGLIEFAKCSGALHFNETESDSASYKFLISYELANETGTINQKGTYKLIEKGNYMNLSILDSNNNLIAYSKYRVLTLTSTDLQLEFSDGENTFIYIMKRK
ncbi:MAG: hypothetical protein ACK50Y_04525 [Flavobacteriia bacterium]|jgi:hypothetical protein